MNNYKHVDIKLMLPSGITIDEIRKKTADGYRFIVYQYTVSIIFAITFRLFSKAHFIKGKNEARRLKNKYNLITALLGWWTIPWGFIYSFQSFTTNKNGGLDVTDDVLLNLTEEALQAGKLQLTKTNNLFVHPDKWEIKALRKTFSPDLCNEFSIKSVVAGSYINTSENEEPYLTIGIQTSTPYDSSIEPIKSELYKHFYNHTHIEIINLDDDNLPAAVISKQGIRIIPGK